jgi:hypothetical protein
MLNDNQSTNMSIGCNVCECKYHTKDDHCSLDTINVSKNGSITNMASPEFTECASYKKA